jgi:hypothetical protein
MGDAKFVRLYCWHCSLFLQRPWAEQLHPTRNCYPWSRQTLRLWQE